MPILGLALLAALLLQAWRAADTPQRLQLTGIAAIAGTGLLFVHAGLVALAGSVSLSAAARVADAAGASGYRARRRGAPGRRLRPGAVRGRHRPTRRRWDRSGPCRWKDPVANGVLGAAVALATLGLAVVAPLTWGALAIWSGGLAGVVPAGIASVAIGVGLAGAPLLHARHSRIAIGAGISILAGFDLSASGLVLAGFLGLAAAQSGRALVEALPALPGGPGRRA